MIRLLYSYFDGTNLVYDTKSSYLIIPPDNDFTNALDNCWNYCHSLPMNNTSLYQNTLDNNQLPQYPLIGIATDGIYLVRCSICNVQKIDKEHYNMTITDGTAKCTVFVDKTILEYFQMTDSVSALVILWRSIHL